MRQLIDVTFQDNTSYPSQVGADVGGIVIDCPWGATDTITKVNLDNFLSKFPIPKTMEITPSHLTAYRAILSGMETLEIYRYSADSTKFISFSADTGDAEVTLTDLDGQNKVISLKYKGFHPDFKISDRRYKISYRPHETDPDTLVVELYYLSPEPGAEADFDSNAETEAEGVIKTVVERIEGGFTVGQVVDGQDFFLSAKLNASKYFSGEGLTETFTPPTEEKIISLTSLLDTAWTAATLVTDLVECYSEAFSDIESSEVSIIIDPGTTSKDEADILIGVAQTRTDCTALIGYPVADPWNPGALNDPVVTYKQSLTPSMMSAFYALREKVTLYGRTYVLNGVGTIAGRYSHVATQESVNQIPSAKTWGAFGGVIAKKLSFAQALEWHSNGINSVYNSSQGPRIYGLRSLHPRESSYYSRFNISRVCARILKYGFGIAMDVIHTGNTDTKKALAQNLLSADLERLKAKGVLKTKSKVICAPGNNLDADTNGGKFFNIDYEIYFVSLIERVRISITATDDSVTSEIS